MEKITIKYQTNNELWKLEDELKAKGYKKVADCHWVQVFEDENGNEVIAERD